MLDFQTLCFILRNKTMSVIPVGELSKANILLVIIYNRVVPTQTVQWIYSKCHVYKTDPLLRYLCAISGHSLTDLYTLLSTVDTGNSCRAGSGCYTCLRATQAGNLHRGPTEHILSSHQMSTAIMFTRRGTESHT